ncbi:MAG: efflux RND transporter permease subunit [Acidobacteriota bacterium]
MSITRLALGHRTVTLVFLALMVIAGAISYKSLPRAEDPGFVIRVAVVSTQLPGASPEQVELLVTDPIEEVIDRIPEVDYVVSESRAGVSVIEVAFLESLSEAAIEDLFDELRETVADARRSLPPEAIGPLVDDDFGDVFGTVVAITGEGYDVVELERVAERARLRLLTLQDVARVEIVGAQAQRVFVEYDPARLDELGLTAGQLAEILRQRNVLDAAGDVRSARERFELDLASSFESVEAIESMRFRRPGSEEILTLGDIATVRRGVEEPAQRTARYNGHEAVVLAISMRPGGKITRLGPEVLQVLDEMRVDLPIGLDTHLVSYQTTYVDKSVDNFLASLLQGVAIVLLVMLVALGLRTGLIVAAVVPLTMVGSLVVMELAGISMNKMSLAALIIALGLLVDSAIVVAESILVSIREGVPPVEAAVESAAELRLPLLVSSLTTAAALLPTYLAESTTGEYTSAIFEVVTIALLLAWLLSLTLTPVLSVLFARAADSSDGDAPNAPERESTGDGAESTEPPPVELSSFQRRYRSVLLVLVRRRWIALTAFVALFAVSLWAFNFVPQLFFPRKEQTTFKVALEMPYGVPFQRTAEVVDDVERFILTELMADRSSEAAERTPWRPNLDLDFTTHGIVNFATFIGQAAPRFVLGYAPEQPRPSYAFMIANSSRYATQDEIIERVEAYVRAAHPDVLPRVDKLRNGPPLDYPVEIRLSGDDPARLVTMAERVKRRLEEVPGTLNIGDDWGTYTKTLRIEVDDARAQRAGLTQLDVARSLRTQTDGFVLSQLREGNDLIPIVLRSFGARADGVEQLRGLAVTAPSGERVPLEQIASLDVAMQPARILRRDRQRTITVQADVDPRAGSDVTAFSVIAAVEPLLREASATWPLGYHYALGGEVESSGKAQASIGAKMPIAVLLVLMLLVLQFNSLRGPLIVVATLPFTLIGVVAGLLLTQKPFGFMALLGVIALIGVVINNAVVLLDRIETEQKRGHSRASAVLEASRRRLRPILLTTATTVGGLIPLWLTGGPMFSPMAVAFLFGLITSTLLTLGLVPVLYSILYRVDFGTVTE